MTELPSAAKAVLQAARTAHDPSDQDVARSLARLSASLTFAPEPGVGAAELAQRASETNLHTSSGLLAAKLTKLSLVMVAVSGVLGGVWLSVQPSSQAHRTQLVAPAASLSVGRATDDPAATERAPADTRSPARAATAAATPPPSQSRVVPQPAPSQQTAADSTARATRARTRPSPMTSARSVPKPEPVWPAPTTAVALSDRATHLDANVKAEPSAAPVPVSVEETTSTLQTAKRTVAPVTAVQPTAPSELTLLDGAAQRLRNGDEEGALRLLDEHLALYPAGVLRTERAGLRVLSLCALGRVTQGRAERTAFLAAAAGTPLAVRVRRACSESKEP